MQRATPTDVHPVLDKYLSLASYASLPPRSASAASVFTNSPATATNTRLQDFSSSENPLAVFPLE